MVVAWRIDARGRERAGVLDDLEGEGRAARFGREFAADFEQGVADGFGFEALAVHAPEETVLRVEAQSLGVVGAAEPVGTAEDESAEETLLRPPVGHEARRQVVEQFGVGGAFAAFAEIVDAADEPFAEELLPKSIRRDASRQRVAAVRDPFGELQAAALAGRYRGELVPRGDA